MRNFRNWEVYQNSKKLTLHIYQLTQTFPEAEKYGLISQLRRASVSIVANIAEGAGRNTDKDFKNFLSVAIGSAFEVEALLELSTDLKYLEQNHLTSLIDSLTIVQKQLNAFITKLK